MGKRREILTLKGRDREPTIAAVEATVRGDFRNAIVASTPGGIEAQEKAGQTALVSSTDMPISLQPSREAFEALGFKFGEKIDELFVKAELPAGWKREATDHSMHSNILDAKGRKRVGVFYKAAFYDRKANAHLNNRFRMTKSHYEGEAKRPEKGGSVSAMVKDESTGEILFTSKPYTYQDWAAEDMAEHEVTLWMNEHYPQWDDPTKWWD